MRIGRARASLFAICLTIAPASLARADAASPDAAAAQALFDAGKAAMDANDYVTACAKFQASEALEPAPGTLFFWAGCEEKRGHVATAWGLLVELEQKLPESDPRRAQVIDSETALAPRVPHVTIHLAPGTPAGAAITLDAQPLGMASVGTALPVDPGKHEFMLSAPGHSKSRTALELREGQTEDVTLALGPPEAAKPPEPAKPPLASSRIGARAAAGITVGSVGVAAMAAGIVTGVVAKSRWSDSAAHCNARDLCDPTGLDVRDGARGIGTAGTVVFVAGAVATTVGLVVWLTAPRSEGGLVAPARVSVRFAPNGVALGGTWSTTR
jgi:hypothetical protein